MFLKNTSSRDAENVYLLVNFVGAGGELLGTLSHNVNYIPAGQTFNYGDEMSLRTQLLVTKLEVTVRVGGGAPAVPHPVPHFSNILIVPDRGDPTWVSEVDGEVANDTSPATMTSAQISVVVLDPNGAIVGGGQTTLYTALPSGSRMVFLAQSGFSDIPSNKAGSSSGVQSSSTASAAKCAVINAAGASAAMTLPADMMATRSHSRCASSM